MTPLDKRGHFVRDILLEKLAKHGKSIDKKERLCYNVSISLESDKSTSLGTFRTESQTIEELLIDLPNTIARWHRVA